MSPYSYIQTLNLSDFSPSLNASSFGIDFDVFKSVNHILLTAFGIPLNLFIVIVIVINQRLKKKPRNILFLGASLSAVFTLLTILVELLAYHFHSDALCKIFGLSTGVAYSNLLYNICLALLDRYLAIVRPLHHRKIVTVKNVLIIQIVGAVAIFFLFKWPYVFGVVPLQCGFKLIKEKAITLSNTILLILCVVLNVAVYIKTKHYARPGRALSVSYCANSHQQQANRDIGEHQQIIINFAATNSIDGSAGNNQERINESTAHRTASSTTFSSSRGSAQQQNQCICQVHGGNRRRMEVNATITLINGVSSLLIFSAPILIIAFIEWGCRLIVNDVDSEEEHCAPIVVVLSYCREFLLYHLVYNPIVHMIRNEEFSAVLTEKWARINRVRRTPFGSAIRNRINTNKTRLIPRQTPPITNL